VIIIIIIITVAIDDEVINIHCNKDDDRLGFLKLIKSILYTRAGILNDISHTLYSVQQSDKKLIIAASFYRTELGH
jgi:hypothetical protein